MNKLLFSSIGYAIVNTYHWIISTIIMWWKTHTNYEVCRESINEQISNEKLKLMEYIGWFHQQNIPIQKILHRVYDTLQIVSSYQSQVKRIRITCKGCDNQGISIWLWGNEISLEGNMALYQPTMFIKFTNIGDELILFGKLSPGDIDKRITTANPTNEQIKYALTWLERK